MLSLTSGGRLRKETRSSDIFASVESEWCRERGCINVKCLGDERDFLMIPKAEYLGQLGSCPNTWLGNILAGMAGGAVLDEGVIMAGAVGYARFSLYRLWRGHRLGLLIRHRP